MNSDSLTYLRRLVHTRAALVIDEDKDYLLRSRLEPVAKRVGLADIDALVAELRRERSPELVVDVVEALTTNETYFFRDQHPFEALRQHILPALARTRSTSRVIRIWCAAASTGQEPYSVAMTVLDALPDASLWTIDIVATDINRTVLERARRGVYKQHEVDRGLPPEVRGRWFERCGQEWSVRSEVQRCVRFEALNLLDPWPWREGFDVVFMRNVLIYFDVATKRGLLSRVREHLAPDGVLFLGSTETTLNLDDAFVPVRDRGSLYFRIG